MADIAVAADVAGECRPFQPVIAPADDCVIVQVAETAALNPISRAIDLITTPEAKIDCAAGRIIAEHRRGGAAIDVDGTIGVRIGEIGAGETVWLRHRKSILERKQEPRLEEILENGRAFGST